MIADREPEDARQSGPARHEAAVSRGIHIVQIVFVRVNPIPHHCLYVVREYCLGQGTELAKRMRHALEQRHIAGRWANSVYRDRDQHRASANP